MITQRNDVRLALPSKGRLEADTLDFLEQAGLRVYKPNPRQFEATIPNLPGLIVLFQRAADIAVSVREGSVDFGITGWDVMVERCGEDGEVLPLQRDLGFRPCTLNVIVPESWPDVHCMRDLFDKREELGHALRVATKFPNLTRAFFNRHDLRDTHLIQPEGTLEVAPAIGFADLIVDLVSTGTTLRDNRLRRLEDGLILSSQACLIGNRRMLKERAEVRAMARQLIEFSAAYLRAKANVAVFANMRGESPKTIAERMLTQVVIGGLQGPTISQVITRDGENWYAVNIVVRKDQLAQAIAELRSIGGSGVFVTPVTYIFEEEPEAYRAMVEALEKE